MLYFNFSLLFCRIAQLKLIKMSLNSSDNPVFSCFSFYAALLGAKTLSMAFLTAKQRFAKKVTLNINPSHTRSL